MGMSCWGLNNPYLMAVQACLEAHAIPVPVQDSAMERACRSGRLLSVRDGDHDRAIRCLRKGGLDPTRAMLSSNG